MLDLKLLREDLDNIERRLSARGGATGLDGFRGLDDQRRKLLGEVERLKAERNQVSALIGKTQNKSEVQAEIQRMKEVSHRIKNLDEKLRETEENLKNLMLTIPNIPDEECPLGASEEDNSVLHVFGSPPDFDFEPKAHWDLGESLGILDFERAAKITGSRFAMAIGAGARLERALINFMLDMHTQDGNYVEVLPPFLVNRQTMTGTGQLPKFEEDLFHLEDPDYFLIPTAEVPVTNIFRDEILDAEQLPICYTAYTPCFRKEAGAHGRDTRGLIRQHQFNKVELVKFTRPEDSEAELGYLLSDAEKILQTLNLPYRVVDLCTADLGFSAARTFDIEVWLPGQQAYREISSCSNFRDFQSRRAGIRFRREAGSKPEFVHTLNGSGLAVGRTMVAILENYQKADGSVIIPKALQSYMGGLEKIG
ncbi:MAG: serine--tRNA ligase [Deltaproteobacteria bacterium]|jgi:seryl-tRNA synthetase|nr:serine--tRNA ligase [Deltaproteobacteria bacterium]